MNIDIVELAYMESEIDYMETKQAIDLVSYSIICEAGDSSISKTIESAKKKLKETIEKIKKKIMEISKSSKVKQMEKAIKNDPSLKNKKIEMDDFNSLNKLSVETMGKLKKTDDPDKTMDEYKKKRKKIIDGRKIFLTLAGAMALGGATSIKQLTDVDRMVNDTFRIHEQMHMDAVRQHQLMHDSMQVANDASMDCMRQMQQVNMQMMHMTMGMPGF